MIWLRLGAMMMFLGVAFGAFGSHALRTRMTDYYFDVYRTGVFYHLIHALALLFVAWLSTFTSDSKVYWAGILLVCGIVLFSGSLYLLALTGQKWLGAITPFGGLAFLGAWVLIALAAWMR